MQPQDKIRIAVFAAYAIALHGIERLIPTPLPWLRFGFANIITITVLMLYGLRIALILTVVRVTVGSILLGTFLGPAFILSLSGGVFSTLVMGGVRKWGIFSPFGLSLFGAVSHSFMQIVVAFFLLVNSVYALLVISPVIMLLSTLTGALNGLAAIYLLNSLQKSDNKSII